MTSTGIRLGRIFGIEVSANFGVLAIAALLTWSLAQGVLPSGAPGHVAITYWSVAFVVAVLFVFSLLAHELAHSVVARRNGIGVEGIHLWLFGGVSQLTSEPKTPGAEFRITLVGPGTSLLLGALAWGTAYGINAAGGPSVYVAGLSWLGVINVFLGLFNLLPGAPLDGGRLVAAVLWRIRHDRISGQIGAAKVGRVVAMLIIGVGAFEIFQMGSLAGLWTMFIGWFLLSAARNEQGHYELERAIGQVTVAKAMTPDPHVASPLSTVAQVANGALVAGHQSAVPILDWDGRLIALVTVAELSMVPRDQWDMVTALATVRPGTTPVTAQAGEPLMEVLERMGKVGATHAVVLDAGRVVGLVGPEQIEHAAREGVEHMAHAGQ